MITKEDVKHLAKLSRIEITESEVENLTKEIDSILGYVGQIQEAAGDVEKETPKLINVMRDDVVTHTPGQYSESLLANAPAIEGKYVKVKKILG